MQLLFLNRGVSLLLTAVYSQYQERIMKEGRGGGKEREAPTHFIEISVLTHAARITKNSQTTGYYVAKRK